MGRKCFISCKTEDFAYKKIITDDLDIDMIDKSLHDAIDSTDEDYIMQKIREDYLSDSTVTIHLIGPYSAENKGWAEQKFIKRELQASLYHGAGNTQNGILGIVLPTIYDQIYTGLRACTGCGQTMQMLTLNDSTTVAEFSYNYFIPNAKCHYTSEDRFCILVKWDDFVQDPEKYIEQAFQKRTSPIAEKTKVRP